MKVRLGVERYIKMAIDHANANGIQPGAICATIEDCDSFELVRFEGEKAIVLTSKGYEEERKRSDVFEVNQAIQFAMEHRNIFISMRLAAVGITMTA